MNEKNTIQQEIITVGETRVGNAFGHPKDFQIILERGVRAEMRDGLTLATNVYRPALPGKYPVLLHLSPQGKDRFPADSNYERIPNTGIVRVSEWVVFEAQDPVYWVPHGYVVVVADCRATWHSDGDHFEHFSPQMAEDFHDLVEWAAQQACHAIVTAPKITCCDYFAVAHKIAFYFADVVVSFTAQ